MSWRPSFEIVVVAVFLPVARVAKCAAPIRNRFVTRIRRRASLRVISSQPASPGLRWQRVATIPSTVAIHSAMHEPDQIPERAVDFKLQVPAEHGSVLDR